jgi:hypothetical protein
VPLPFPFLWNGTNQYVVNVSSNGFISFNAVIGAVNGSIYNPLSLSTTSNVISAFSQDLVMGVAVDGSFVAGSNTITGLSSSIGFSVGDVIYDYNSDFASNPTITAISGSSMVVNLPALNSSGTNYVVASAMGGIWQRVTGTAPNRVCEFEFTHFCRFIQDEIINFKIKLYETSGKIEVVYGDCIAGADNTPSEVGLKGNSNTDFNSRKVAGNTWNSSVPATNIADVCDFNATSAPSSGLTYIWAPPTCTVPVLKITATSTLLCNGGSATLTASGASNYTWSSGTWTPGPNSSQIIVTPTTNTGYGVSAGTSTCITTEGITIMASDCTGLRDDVKTSIGFDVYPNPFSGSLTIRNNGDAASITILDALGKMVYTTELDKEAPTSIETSFLHKGLYFVSYRSATGTVTRKIIKE